MSSNISSFTLLEYDPDREQAWVHDSWARSYSRAVDVRRIPKRLFYPWHRDLREQILSRSTCLVLKDSDNPDYIYGYVVAERLDTKLVIHWAYIRSVHRRSRLGFKLLDAAIDLSPNATKLHYTHRTWFSPVAERFGFSYIKLEDLHYGH